MKRGGGRKQRVVGGERERETGDEGGREEGWRVLGGRGGGRGERGEGRGKVVSIPICQDCLQFFYFNAANRHI